MKALVIAAIVLAAAGTAHAYPQFQLSRDETCSGCHVSPAGGGLLHENGFNTAESMSQYGTSPEFMYGKIGTPDWLELGGDLRAQDGYLQTPQKYLIAFPMQADVYASATFGSFRVQADVGYRPPEYGNENLTRVWSREHYVEWRSEPGTPGGVFVRVGRLMPVFGLRLAEHPSYERRYGGTPLYSETYGAVVSYITPAYEGHVSAFIKDKLIDAVEHVNGAAAYGELRLSEHASVGVEGMLKASSTDKVWRGGVTGKLHLPGPDVLLQGELQYVFQNINAGGAPNGILAYVMGSWFADNAIMVDLALGHWDENFRIKNLDKDAVELNVHWFATSHFEAVLNTRIELIGQGNGGPTGAYALLQGHYRL